MPVVELENVGVKETIREEEEMDDDAEVMESSLPFKVVSAISSKKLRTTNSTLKHRNAMGEFIPPSGFRPLTMLAYPTPGPSDYSPNMDTVLNTAPKYSLHDRISPRREKFLTPGPKYNLRDRRQTCHLRITRTFSSENIRRSDKIKATARRVQKRTPACYQKNYSSLKKNSAILLSKPKDGIHFGPKPDIVMQSDTVARANFPAPNKYRPRVSAASKGTICYQAQTKLRKKPAKHPGPAHYTVPALVPGGPRFTIKTKHDDAGRMKSSLTPSAASYMLPSSVGQGLAYSIGLKLPKRSGRVSFERRPGPSDYKPHFELPGRFFTFSYRPLPRKKPWTTPSPSKYDTTLPKKSSGPTFGTRNDLMIDYQRYAVVKKLDLPVSYTGVTDFGSTCKCLVQLKSKRSEKKEETLAPNAYYPDINVSKPSSFKFSFGRKIVRKGENKCYTNALYYPQLSNGVSFSLIGRLNPADKDTIGPDHYFPKATRKGLDCNQGPSLKSRQSPFVCSGFTSRKPLKQHAVAA